MSDLALVDPAEAIERAVDPGEFVLAALERGKTWLAEALAHGDLEALVNAKGWAATLRTATMQKQLGHDAELSATELVRRAERCIGLGIRQGQAEGDINSQFRRREREGSLDKTSLPAPTDYATPAELSGNEAGIYAMTDGVSDEEFEEALAAARAEGELARANVVRKIKGTTPPPPPAPTRHDVHRNRRHIDPVRIVEESIAMLEGIASGLALIEDIQSIDAEKRQAWSEALRLPLSAINRFKKEISG